jgi:mannitol/fructose-specific phosphotransferase system IIA component (Ntr-type)
MKSLLNALQEGRLIELPDNDKDKSLEYLATILEAIPDINPESGITEDILLREKQNNTSLGKSWACPHARSAQIGDLLCAVGWSPKGIDYHSKDGKPVHLVVMYYVPEAQKHAYLKEISSLAKALLENPELENISELKELSEVRHHLLDVISLIVESTAPEAKARMIQLEVKQFETSHIPSSPLPEEIAKLLVPLSILTYQNDLFLVLCQDPKITLSLEAHQDLMTELKRTGKLEHDGIHLYVRSSASYATGKILYDCLAINTAAIKKN